MNITEFPKDLIILTSLELDMQTILNLCLSSRNFNNNICGNNNFWINKLKHDYDINFDQSEARSLRHSPKEYYKYVYEFINSRRKYISYEKRKFSVNNHLLLEATKFNNLDIVKYAINQGTDTSLNHLLVVASENGHLGIVKYLLSKGADIHYDNGRALRGAVRYEQQDVITYLLEQGAIKNRRIN